MSAIAEPRRRRRRWWWALIGCVLVVAASAATTTVFLLGQVHTLVNAISQNRAVKVKSGTLAGASVGGAQTLLLVGNDQRNHTTTAPVLPHSNEMLLVRFDPNKPWISMLSIPRELLTTIDCPNGGPVTTRFNYSLTCGGFTTLVSTIKQVTGLSVNHVVMIDFNNFKTAVDDMGCVYSTIDRRYYHVNTAYSQQYQEINLQPGYQQLCGTQALQFVSYRHGDTSLVRDARDQTFLLSVKQQFGPTLVDNVDKFEQIFGRLVTTDQSLHTTDGVLDLLETLISSAGDPVRQVQIPVDLAPTNPLAISCACVTSTPGQIAGAVHSFLFGSLVLHKGDTAKTARAVRSHKALAALPLAPTPSSELAQGVSAARKLPFVLEFPRVQDAGGTGIPIDVRDYHLHAPGGAAYPAFVEVFSNGMLGQYYDVQGTTWTTPPLLDSPNQSVRVGGRNYYLYYTGAHLLTVAWYEHHAVYWIHNTLLDSIDNTEMLALAEQTAPAGTPEPVAPGKAPTSAVVTAPPNPLGAAASQTTIQKIGSIGGLMTLIAAPLLAFALYRRRREHALVRVRLQDHEVRAARLQAALAGVGPGDAATRVPEPVGPITIHRAGGSVSRRTTAIVTGLVAVVVAAGTAAYALSGTGSDAHHVVVKRAAVPTVPTVPVAVLNATRTEGAAAELAKQLQSHRVRVDQVANVVDSGAPGLSILYVPGSQRQAARLAHLLAPKSATIAPIDPSVAAAAGSAAKLAVVIT
jgi:polyisoprenyl-teichoic acid--peptidoglycan teichoic acid transferase